MRSACTVVLMMLFSWNSVLGGIDALILCLHPEGDAHVELLGKDAPVAVDCASAEHSIRSSDCTPCTDLVLASAEIGAARIQEVASVQVPTPMVGDSPKLLPRIESAVGRQIALSHPTRDPPGVEPASEMFRRLIVLRL